MFDKIIHEHITEACKHKYGPIQPDRYQYCEICNKAHAAPPVTPISCDHKWEKTNERIQDSYRRDVGYIMQCAKCGILDTFKL